MSIPNIGPAHPDPNDPETLETVRRGNPSLVYRDEPVTDDVTAASARASSVSQRFGGVRSTLSRPGEAAGPVPPVEEGESDVPE